MAVVTQANARNDILTDQAAYIARAVVVRRSVPTVTFTAANLHSPYYNIIDYDPFDMALSNGTNSTLTCKEAGTYIIILQHGNTDRQCISRSWCGIYVNGTLISHQGDEGPGNASDPFGLNLSIQTCAIADLALNDTVQPKFQVGVSGGNCDQQIFYQLAMCKLNRFTNPTVAGIRHTTGESFSSSNQYDSSASFYYTTFDEQTFEVDPNDRITLVNNDASEPSWVTPPLTPGGQGRITINEDGVYYVKAGSIYQQNATIGINCGLQIHTRYGSLNSSWEWYARPFGYTFRVIRNGYGLFILNNGSWVFLDQVFQGATLPPAGTEHHDLEILYLGGTTTDNNYVTS